MDPRLLEALVDAPDIGVRTELANNGNTSAVTLERLAADPEQDVRAAAASNPNIAADTLSGLADDSRSVVRLRVGWNPNASAGVLRRLAAEPAVRIRGCGPPPRPTPTLPSRCLNDWRPILNPTYAAR